MFKKLIALISAITMLLSFAACGEGQEETTTTTEKSKDTVATELVTDDKGEVVTNKDGEKVTVTVDNKTEKDKTTEKDGKTTNKDNSNTEKTTNTDGGETTKPTTTKPTTTNKADTKPSTKAEIVDYYNKAVNKVKSSAKSVVKFYDNSTNYKGIVEAGGLSKVGKMLMDTFLKENHKREVFEGTANIVNAFPVEAQKTSTITPDVIKTAKCEDKGEYYEITLIANCSDSKPDVNPPKNGGVVGKMFNILVPTDITDATDKAGALLELKGIKYSYMGGEIVARVDKATGNMTYLYTKLPMILSFEKARALALVVDNAAIGLQFENKWEINW